MTDQLGICGLCQLEWQLKGLITTVVASKCDATTIVKRPLSCHSRNGTGHKSQADSRDIRKATSTTHIFILCRSSRGSRMYDSSHGESMTKFPLSVTTGPAFAFPMRNFGCVQPIFCNLWRTEAQANGATSMGTPCFHAVPSISEFFLASAIMTNVFAASARTFSRRWHAPPPLMAFRAWSTSSAPSIVMSICGNWSTSPRLRPALTMSSLDWKPVGTNQRCFPQ